MGDSEIDQLYKIFSIMGTPDNDVWKGVEQLPNYRDSFPKYKKKGFKSFITDSKLENLISNMLIFDPLDRMTAEEALNDGYFDGLPPIYE